MEGLSCCLSPRGTIISDVVSVNVAAEITTGENAKTGERSRSSS